ncbi:MAG: sensor histidine kinase [Coleofasciculus sp. G1-WW12-02]|uniref:sensor histidine kinase n=1 Tax=Coleofasciculus sp. G1-WW12-02 TaxID=3068483 RepID=UPI0032F8141F
MNFSQELLNKLDSIVNNWVEAVRQDGELESAHELTYKAVLDGLPSVLRAIAKVLCDCENGALQTIEEKGLEHGVIRAKQGYDPTEVAREYRILRQIIFSHLEPDLLRGSSAEVLQATRIIDMALDEVIGRCFNSYTEERLQELEKLQSQVNLTNHELTRLVETHRENLAHLAHDLKNPLQAILISSDLFVRQHKTQDTVVSLDHIERVLRNGQQILHLINDSLEVSRHEAGQVTLHAEVLDVCALINNVVDTLTPSASEKDLKITVDYELAPKQVTSDPLRLEQIITNLVSNAIRYTETGSITISCQVECNHQNDKFAIAVADTGIGIAPEDQAQIFEPYFRGGSRTNRLPDSTGLGLAIVSRLVKLLQGEIQLDSEVGVGSTFKIILPLAVKTPARTSVSSVG